MSNYLGIDYGQKKIGLAVSLEGTLAFGFGVVKMGKSFWNELAEIISLKNIDLVVVGIPLGNDGKETPSSLLVTKFVSEFQKRIKGKKVVMIDERFTSQEAQRNLKGSNKDDKEAARIILQSYLDREEKNLKFSI